MAAFLPRRFSLQHLILLVAAFFVIAVLVASSRSASEAVLQCDAKVQRLDHSRLEAEQRCETKVQTLETDLIGKDETIRGMSNKIADLKKAESIQASQRQDAVGMLQSCQRQAMSKTPAQDISLKSLGLSQMLDTFMYDIDLGREMGGSVDDKYGAEQLFINLLGKSQFRTTDPRQATFFFMPFRCTAYRKSVESREAGGQVAMLTAAAYVQRVLEDYPYWNATAGSDHFYICAHDMGASVSRLAAPELGKNAIALVNTADYREPDYVPHKDIALPPNVDVVAAIHVAAPAEIELDTARLHQVRKERLAATGSMFPHPDMADEPLLNRRMGFLSRTGQGGRVYPAYGRSKLAFFAGNLSNGNLRAKVRAVVENDPDFDIVSGQLDKKAYMKRLASSRFCLFLRGHRAWSPRLMDALFTGCIPVIISDHYDLPLRSVLRWQEFSIIVPEGKIASLKATLQSVPSSTITAMQKRIQEVYHHFVWNDPPGYMDAFHMVLFELWKRSGVVKYT